MLNVISNIALMDFGAKKWDFDGEFAWGGGRKSRLFRPQNKRRPSSAAAAIPQIEMWSASYYCENPFRRICLAYNLPIVYLFFLHYLSPFPSLDRFRRNAHENRQSCTAHNSCGSKYVFRRRKKHETRWFLSSADINLLSRTCSVFEALLKKFANILLLCRLINLKMEPSDWMAKCDFVLILYRSSLSIT